MATYTNFYFKAKLAPKNTQELEMIELLEKIANGNIEMENYRQIFKHEDVTRPAFDHPFFDCQWYMLFKSVNWTDGMLGSKITRSTLHRRILEINTEFVDRAGMIDKFIDWISPIICSRKKKLYVGHYRVEYMDKQIKVTI